MTNQSVPDSAPYSQEAEEALIGAVLINPDAFLTISEFLKADDFYFLTTGYIWQAMQKLHDHKDPIDELTVAEELDAMGHLQTIGGRHILISFITNTPTSVHAEIYGRIVERLAVRRRLIQISDEIRMLAHDQKLSVDEVTSEAESRLFSVTDRQLKREFVTMSDAVNKYFDQIEHLFQNQQDSMGIPSGFRDLDTLLGGFQRSDLLIFAGRPGMGKCVAGDTLIPTGEGLLKIEKLMPQGVEGTPDDEGGTFYPFEIDVQTPFGIQKTSHFYVSPPKPTLMVKTRASYFIVGTHNHLLLTIAEDGSKTWKALADIHIGDKVAAQWYDPNVDDVVDLLDDSYSSELRALVALPRIKSNPRFLWDEVTVIEERGEQVCYDLTVPDGHAFVANGMVNHNTSFLLTTAVNVARLNGRVAIFTMEMGVEQLVQRMISMETGINTQKLRLGKLNHDEYSRFVEASRRISNFPIYIDDTPALSPMEMRTKCRRLQHERGIDLIIVDYMQLMNAGGQYQNNRVQEISYISRSLKELARELNVPLFSAAQLSRAVEQRQDKRPVLSDLRESGCLAGDTLIHLHNEGHYVPIRDLVGKTGFHVTSLNQTTWKLEPGVVTNAFSTGVKPIFKMTTRSGRSIRATANHKFLTISGWKRLDELTTEDHIAVPRIVPSPTEQTMNDSELALLAHLIGDGCTLPTHAIQVVPAMQDIGMTTRHLHKGLGMAYAGTTLYKQNVSRERATRVAEITQCHALKTLAESDVYWDQILSIEPDGEEEVFDLTVDEHHNFMTYGILAHNSIEQDSDIVMFLYRDVMYNEATEFPNQADIIIAKHRNGPTGTISLFFDKTITKFLDGTVRSIDLGGV